MKLSCRVTALAATLVLVVAGCATGTVAAENGSPSGQDVRSSIAPNTSPSRSSTTGSGLPPTNTPQPIAVEGRAALSASPGTVPSIKLISGDQVQPIHFMPAAARAQAKVLLGILRTSTLPQANQAGGPPHSIFDANSTVTVNLAKRDGQRALLYSWTAFSAAPMEKCGSYYLPSFIETTDAVVIYIGEQYGPNAAATDMCAANGKGYSARLPLKAPLGKRVVIDVGIGVVVQVA